MPRTLRTSLPLALAVALLAAGATTLRAGDDAAETHRLKLHLKSDAGSERLEIDDLGDLAVGESRSFTTDSGKAVIVTRDENGYAVDFDGRTIRIGGGADGDWTGAPGERVHRLHKLEIEDDGGSHLVVGDDAREHRVVVRKSADGHGFAFSTDGSAPRVLLAGPGLLDRVERNEKFLALDDATREIVREIVREAAQPLEWIEEGGEGEGERMEVWVERHRRDEGDDQ